MKNIPSVNDSLEMLLTKNITHVLQGFHGEVAFASLSKVMIALIIGLSPDKQEASNAIAKLTEHFENEIAKVNDRDFGYVKRDNGAGPITAPVGQSELRQGGSKSD